MEFISCGGYYISQDTTGGLLMDFKIAHAPFRNESEDILIRNPIRPNGKVLLSVNPAF